MEHRGFARAKARVLIADNNPEWLRLQKDAFLAEGFEVLTADGPTAVLQLLREETIDAAVYDIRLEDDDDDHDISGLELAGNTPNDVGKVITTRYPIDMPTGQPFKDKVGPESPFVSYVDKDLGIPAIVAAAKKVAIFSLISRNGMAYWQMITNPPQRQSRSHWSTLTLLVFMLVALGLGVAAFITGNPKWLFGTIGLAVVTVVLIGRLVD